MHLRAPNKVILATMYFVFAVVQFQTNYELLSYHLLLMVALFLAWMGDVFLMFDFNRGGDFSSAATYAFHIRIGSLYRTGT